MTTIAADPATGLMVADSNISDSDQKWKCDKVEVIDGAFYAAAGDAVDGDKFYDWARKGKRGRKPKLSETEFEALVLNKKGLFRYDSSLYPLQMKHPFAIGSGGKAARAALIALGEAISRRDNDKPDIVRAVEIVCEVDAGSCLPVQIYDLAIGGKREDIKQ